MTKNNIKRSRLGIAIAATTACLLAGSTLIASPATAFNSVTIENGDAWNVHDAANPGVDTGSVTDNRSKALMGYGGIRVDVSEGASPINGILLRGFGLDFDGINSFESTRAVDIDGVLVQRQITVDDQEGYGRFFDSFTNSGTEAVSVEVAFGGQLGYNTGTNQSSIAATSSGDFEIDSSDSWSSWYTPSAGVGSASQNGPSATVFGTAGSDNSLDRVGNFLLDPFNVALPASGDAANHPGFVHSLVIEPGETVSVLHYVVTGLSEVTATAPNAPIPAAGSEVERVQDLAASLADTPDISGLSSAELCSVQNFELELSSCDAPSGTIQGGITETAAPLKLKTSVSYDVVGKTIVDLQADLANGTTTSQEITQAYLDRIAAYDRGPFGLHSVIAIAPDALEQAAAADAARAAGDDRPLLGIPILAKDIIDVKGLPTTGASLIFDGYMPEKDAWQISKLREAGALIFGKTNLAEFANDGHYSPGAYGQVWNAFDPSRSPIGSSGGSASAVASSFAAAALGTQTGDSLWGPSGAASLFSFRGTDGMQSSAGTMPLTLITDYVGFIAQSTEDLAILLDVAAVDNPDDVLDNVANGNRPEKWDALFDKDALQGKVIGVPVGGFDDPFGTTETSDALKAHFATFEAAGATIVEMPAAPAGGPREYGGDANYEGWAQWIEAHPNSPYSLPEQITRSALRIPSRINTSTYDGAGRMTDADQRGFEAWRASWRDSLGQWMDDSGVDAVLFATPLSDIHLNDSIIPSFGRIDPQSSGAGVPTAIFPAGSNVNGNPVGLQLQGREFQDAELLAFANAFDQHANGRILPTISPALEYDPAAPKQTVSPLPALEQGTPMAAAGYLSGTVSAICENGIPQLSYELNGYGVAVDKEAKLVFETDGKITELPLGTIVAGEAISGTVNWPGITVVNEEIVSWPDWTESNGSWVQVPDAEFAWTTAVTSVKVTAGVKLTQELSYPSSEGDCQITPPGAVVIDPVDPVDPVDPADPTTPGDAAPVADSAKTMPNTGVEIGAMLPLLALVLLFAGAAALWFVNRRKNKTVDLTD